MICKYCKKEIVQDGFEVEYDYDLAGNYTGSYEVPRYVHLDTDRESCEPGDSEGTGAYPEKEEVKE